MLTANSETGLHGSGFGLGGAITRASCVDTHEGFILGCRSTLHYPHTHRTGIGARCPYHLTKWMGTDSRGYLRARGPWPNGPLGPKGPRGPRARRALGGWGVGSAPLRRGRVKNNSVPANCRL